MNNEQVEQLEEAFGLIKQGYKLTEHLLLDKSISIQYRERISAIANELFVIITDQMNRVARDARRESFDKWEDAEEGG